MIGSPNRRKSRGGRTGKEKDRVQRQLSVATHSGSARLLSFPLPPFPSDSAYGLGAISAGPGQLNNVFALIDKMSEHMAKVRRLPKPHRSPARPPPQPLLRRLLWRRAVVRRRGLP